MSTIKVYISYGIESTDVLRDIEDDEIDDFLLETAEKAKEQFKIFLSSEVSNIEVKYTRI